MIEVLKLKVPKITNQNQSYNQKERMISKSYHNRSKTFLLLQHRGLKIFNIFSASTFGMVPCQALTELSVFVTSRN